MNDIVKTEGLEVFKSEGFGEVRTLLDKNGAVWFVANDVCACLGIGSPHNALRRVDNFDKSQVSKITTKRELPPFPGNISRLRVVNESGLYDLVFESDKPDARKFRRWVTNEVLPSINKSGSYTVGQDDTAKDAEWIEARRAGKVVRRQETDVIQKFIEYARAQGSRNAQMYYMNFSKMLNSVAVDNPEKINNPRQFMDIHGLSAVSVAEKILYNKIDAGMSAQLPYKTIYNDAKEALKVFVSMYGKIQLDSALIEGGKDNVISIEAKKGE